VQIGVEVEAPPVRVARPRGGDPRRASGSDPSRRRRHRGRPSASRRSTTSCSRRASRIGGALAHLIGDIHQPLQAHRKDVADSHTSKAEKQFANAADNDDRSGNEIKVSLAAASGGGTKSTVLHSVWDTDLIERQYGGKNEVAVAKGLIQKYAGKAESEGWKKGTVDDWIGASHELATHVAYEKLPGGFACGKDLEHKRIRLTQEYLVFGP
jgi:hypothetical protein